MTNTTPLELTLTYQVADYLALLVQMKRVVCYAHIPQETYTKSWGIKMKNKKMGVHAGVPDMLIVYPHIVLFLELKREKGGTVSAEQKSWIVALQEAGVEARIAKGWDEAKQIIDSYCGGGI